MGHAGDKIYLLEESKGIRPAAFVHKGIVFVATDLESAKRTLDRLVEERPAEPVPSEVRSWLDAVPQDLAMRGAVGNAGGELRRVLGAFDVPNGELDDTVWNGLRGATLVWHPSGKAVYYGAYDEPAPGGIE